MSERDRFPGRPAVAALGALAGSFATIQVAVLAAGALGISLGRWGATLVALASLAVGFALARALWREALAAAGAARTRSRASAPVATVLAIAAVGWAASLWLRLGQLALVRPPYDWDGLYYRLPALSAWARRGSVGWIDGVPDVPFVNYPMGAEAFTFFVHLLIPTSALATATNLWFWPLGFVALAVIATRLGARGPWPWLAAAWLGGVPVMVCQSVSAYTDPAFACTVMAAIAAFMVFVFDRNAPSFARTALLGATVGLMAGAKGSGLPYAIVLLGAAWAAALFVHRAALKRWTAAGALAAALAIVVGGGWYARSALHTGNPLHPIELRIGALVVKPGYDHVAFSEANLPDWLAAYPAPLRTIVAWTERDAPIRGYAPVGGLGYLWVACALPAALVLIGASLSRRRRDRRAVLVLVALVAVLFAVTTSPWWSRFTIWLHALGLPALAVVLDRASAGHKGWLRGLALAALLAVLGVGVWESERTLAIERETGRSAELEVSNLSYRSSLDLLFPGLAETPGMPEVLASRMVARSQWSRLGTLLGGVLAMPLGERELIVLPLAPDARDLARLRGRGIEWLIWDELAAGPLPPSIAARARASHGWRSGSAAAFRIVHLGDD